MLANSPHQGIAETSGMLDGRFFVDPLYRSITPPATTMKSITKKSLLRFILTASPDR
jgi:hypothetical protein